MGFFKYGELPLVILALLARGDMNGYELIGALAKHFRPNYIPSPGSVYPALAALEREKLVEATTDGTTKRFSLTERGVEALASREEHLSEVEVRTGAFLRADEDVLAEMARLESVIRAAQGTVDPKVLRRVLEKARRSVTALMDEEG